MIDIMNKEKIPQPARCQGNDRLELIKHIIHWEYKSYVDIQFEHGII